MPTMDRNGTGLLRGWSLDIYFIKSGNVSCDPKEQCTKDKMGLPFQCFINEVPSSPHHCPACVSPKIWNTWHVRQLRQKSCFHRLFWGRLLCAERWQSRGNHAKNSFQFERPFQGFICSKSSLNILNTALNPAFLRHSFEASGEALYPPLYFGRSCLLRNQRNIEQEHKEQKTESTDLEQLCNTRLALISQVM